MKVLITGASGFVGSRLAELAAAELAPEHVTCLIGPYESDLQRQRTEHLRSRGVRVIPCDLRQSPVLPAELSEFDVLFHLAAYVTTEVNSPDVAINDAGTERLIGELGERLAGKLVLFASTLAAVEATPSARGGLEAPLRPETPPAPRTSYGLSKLRAETTLRERGQLLGFRHVILRLCTVYGSGYRSGGMFDVLPAMLRKRSPFTRLAWSGRLSIVQVDDLVSLFWRCAADSRAWGRTFLVSSGEDPTVSEIIERIAELIEVSYRRLPSPPLLFGLARAALGAHWVWDRLPYSLFIAAWRAELLLDGLFCDGSELTKLFAFRYRRWQDSFADLYRKGGSS